MICLIDRGVTFRSALSILIKNLNILKNECFRLNCSKDYNNDKDKALAEANGLHPQPMSMMTMSMIWIMITTMIMILLVYLVQKLSDV